MVCAVGCLQAGREPEGYRDSEIFKLCQKGMDHLRQQMREARQSGVCVCVCAVRLLQLPLVACAACC
jgi:hypothetical protein